MNVDPLSHNKISKLAAIVLLLLTLSVVIRKNLAKKETHVYRFKIKNKKVEIDVYLPFE